MLLKIMFCIFFLIVIGFIVMFIGIYLIEFGFKNWVGGFGFCVEKNFVEFFVCCFDIFVLNVLLWGLLEYFGFGFSVFVIIIFCECFGFFIMKFIFVIIGFLIGCIIVVVIGYFNCVGIDNVFVVFFIWVKIFKFMFYGLLVLLLMVVFIICVCEVIGDIIVICDVFRFEVEGKFYESRIQGGVLVDGINGMLVVFCIIIFVIMFVQNNGVIVLICCVNRSVGYCCW